jgi:hypothetical protein
VICPYCCRSHARRPPARYCCPEHARRAAAQNARAAYRLRRMWARRRKHAQQLALVAERWRSVATGRKSLEELTAEVWGVREIPAMRDTSE